VATDTRWDLIHAERHALADDLNALTATQWATPSLCDGWTVLDVLGHMTATAKLTPVGFVRRMAGAGFRFTVMADTAVAAEVAGGPAATLREFRAHADATTSPPGPKDTWVGETVLHGEDIRRPLGIRHDYDQQAVRRVADFYIRSNAIVGAKRRVSGLRLVATDAEWTAGDGPEVRGPLLALAMAMTGRSVALDDLTGDGLSTLRSRM
jgi:uncharacterized protein (TIGR03083 family)